jgi:hypothetical protein
VEIAKLLECAEVRRVWMGIDLLEKAPDGGALQDASVVWRKVFEM